MVLSLVSCLAVPTVQGKQKSKLESVEAKNTAEIEKTLSRYVKAKSVKMDLKKELKLALLDRVESSQGQILLAGKQKVRLEYVTPARSVAVINGQKGWVMDYPPKDVQDVVRVLKFSWNKRDKNKFLLASLLTEGSLSSNFLLKKKTVEKDVLTFQFKPKKENQEVLDLVLSVRDKMISELSYLDTLGNKTTFRFSNVVFDKEVLESEFELKIPKDAEVTQM